MAIQWQASKAMIQAGEYVEASVERTVYASVDGRFTIRPYGTMINKSRSGFRGVASYHWSWRGFMLVDNSPAEYKGQRKCHSSATLARAKRQAELLAK
jgi:hypothetical protein